MFREANSFPRANLKENCELRGTDNVQGQNYEHIFKVKWRLLCLSSFKYSTQDWSLQIRRNVYEHTNSLPSKTFTGNEFQFFGLISGTTLSTSRFISSFFTKAKIFDGL